MAYRQKEYNYNDKLTKDQNLLMDKLYKMRMSGMAEAFENQLMNPNSGLESFETRFSEIINHEWSGRENKNEYYGAAEPPVRCGESHLSGLTEPLRSL